MSSPARHGAPSVTPFRRKRPNPTSSRTAARAPWPVIGTPSAAQNEEMEQVRKALQGAEERSRRPAPAPVALSHAVSGLSAETSHIINSRLNALIGFSSVLLDERANPLSVEERREYIKYLHDSAVKLGQTVHALTGSRPAPAEATSTVVDTDRRPPDILVADNDQASRQRIE